MTGNLNGIESVANELRQIASELRVDTFLSLVRTAEVLNRYLDIELSKYGANRARSGILNILIASGGTMRPTDLSRKLFRSKHTITRVVDSLERDGLVRREPIAEDRRLRRVTITKKGLEFVKERVFHRREISDKALSWLDEEQAQQLNSMLAHLRKHLLRYIGNP